MKKHNPTNERIKHKYLTFLKESKGQNESSIDSVAMAFSQFETYTKYSDFKKFHYKQAIGFKAYLAKQTNQQSGKPLSKSTMNTTVRYLKGFFQWLAMQPNYKSRINHTDAEYFNLSEKDTRIATTHRTKPSPTMEQVKYVINSMSSITIIEQRDRALIAFTLLTGARDSAIASLKLKHVNLIEGYVFQDAREVKTKFSKTIKTDFFPVGDDVLKIVTKWVNFLRNEQLWGNDDPLFPKTKISIGSNQLFEANGVKREHWSTANPIREIFRKAFTSAGLPYFNPHSIRHTLTKLGMDVCLLPESFKAWSQNLGHSDVLTTFSSYGQVGEHRQTEIMKQLARPKNLEQSSEDKIAEAVIRKLKESTTIP